MDKTPPNTLVLDYNGANEQFWFCRPLPNGDIRAGNIFRIDSNVPYRLLRISYAKKYHWDKTSIYLDAIIKNTSDGLYAP